MIFLKFLSVSYEIGPITPSEVQLQYIKLYITDFELTVLSNYKWYF